MLFSTSQPVSSGTPSTFRTVVLWAIVLYSVIGFKTGLSQDIGYHPTGSAKVDHCLTAPTFGYSDCSRYVPYGPPANCLQSPPTQPLQDEQGRQVVVILEDNGWESQRITNEVARIVLEEVMGYKVFRLENISTAQVDERVANLESHASLEYWAHYYSTGWKPRQEGGSVELIPIGYLGRSGIYASPSNFRSNGSIFWDYYATYMNASMDGVFQRYSVEDVVGLLPRYTEGPPPPPRRYSLSDYSLVEAATCAEEYCSNGQFYPGVCQVDQVTRLTACGELFLRFPEYDRGYFESLLHNNHLALTAVYLGDHFNRILESHLERDSPMLYYGFEPDPDTKRMNGTRIYFPPETPACVAAYARVPGNPFSNAVGCDLRGTSLAKILSSRLGEDEYMQPALHFLQDLTLSSSDMDALIARYITNRSMSTTELVCEHLREEETFRTHVMLNAVPEVLVRVRTVLGPAVPVPENSRGWQASPGKIVAGLGIILFSTTSVYWLGSRLMSWQKSVKISHVHFSQIIFERFSGPCLLGLMSMGWYYGLQYMSLESSAMTIISYPLIFIICSICVMFGYRFWVTLCAFMKSTISAKVISSTLSSSDAGLMSITVQVIQAFGQSFLLITWVFLILGFWNINTTAIVAVSGFVALGIGFGSSNSIQGFISSLQVAVSQYYEVGDWVQIEGVEGVVTNFSLKTTEIVDFKGTAHYIPNRVLDTAVIANKMRATHAMVGIACTVAANSNPRDVSDFMKNLKRGVTKLNGVDPNELVLVYIAAITETGIKLQVSVKTWHAPCNPQYVRIKNQWGWYNNMMDTQNDMIIYTLDMARSYGLVLTDKASPEPFLATSLMREGDPERPWESSFTRGQQTDNDDLSFLQLKIWSCTYNLNFAKPPLDDGLTQLLANAEGADLVVIGLQQCQYDPQRRTREWKKKVADVMRKAQVQGGNATHLDLIGIVATALGGKYCLVAHCGSGTGDHLIIFGLSFIERLVEKVEYGLCVISGNNHGCSIGMEVLNTSVCFVSTEVPMMEPDAVEKRNQLIKAIMAGMHFGQPMAVKARYNLDVCNSVDFYAMFHHTFWLGSFKYGNSTSYQDMADALNSPQHEPAMRYRRDSDPGPLIGAGGITTGAMTPPLKQAHSAHAAMQSPPSASHHARPPSPPPPGLLRSSSDTAIHETRYEGGLHHRPAEKLCPSSGQVPLVDSKALHLQKLWQSYDLFRQEMNAGNVLSTWVEEAVDYPPTYPYRKGRLAILKGEKDMHKDMRRVSESISSLSGAVNMMRSKNPAPSTPPGNKRIASTLSPGSAGKAALSLVNNFVAFESRASSVVDIEQEDELKEQVATYSAGPGWSDRILKHSLVQGSLEQTSYTMIPDIGMSVHKPVAASFTLSAMRFQPVSVIGNPIYLKITELSAVVRASETDMFGRRSSNPYIVFAGDCLPTNHRTILKQRKTTVKKSTLTPKWRDTEVPLLKTSVTEAYELKNRCIMLLALDLDMFKDPMVLGVAWLPLDMLTRKPKAFTRPLLHAGVSGSWCISGRIHIHEEELCSPRRLFAMRLKQKEVLSETLQPQLSHVTQVHI
ncbi:hypothetical protein CYMTET_7723 [Cymbomonas tetramitiformis]|uniref:C2 domain-containing protein n=1 Tax=Cymbomonas tetramitiformis TaxID=36881 RepID=A0AAE0GUW5_9CHLO|nr:hypothetical protein CYMTET_7723 [Cymbomonas tetramitiformis]